MKKDNGIENFCKIFDKLSAKCLLNVITASSRSYFIRYVENVTSFKLRHGFFKKIFFFLLLWLNGTRLIKISENQKVLVSSILSILTFIRRSQNRVYICHNPKKKKLLTRLKVSLIHHREQKFKHSLQDTLNPICNCGEDIKTLSHLKFNLS